MDTFAFGFVIGIIFTLSIAIFWLNFNKPKSATVHEFIGKELTWYDADVISIVGASSSGLKLRLTDGQTWTSTEHKDKYFTWEALKDLVSETDPLYNLIVFKYQEAKAKEELQNTSN